MISRAASSTEDVTLNRLMSSGEILPLFKSWCTTYRRQSDQYRLPGRSTNTTGMGSHLPVWMRVNVSRASSWVPNPPAKKATALVSFRNMSFRVKKKRQSMNRLSLATNSLACCSKGRRMLMPKLLPLPAPSLPAFMMPGPAPVITMNPSLTMRRANWRAIL